MYSFLCCSCQWLAMLTRTARSTWTTADAVNPATESRATATATTTPSVPPVPQDTILPITLPGDPVIHARGVGSDYMWHISAPLPKTQCATPVTPTRVLTTKISTRNV